MDVCLGAQDMENTDSLRSKKEARRSVSPFTTYRSNVSGVGKLRDAPRRR